MKFIVFVRIEYPDKFIWQFGTKDPEIEIGDQTF